MTPSRWVLLAAAVFAIIGLTFGLSPVTSDGFDCGNGFKEASGLYVDELLDTMRGGTGQNSCDEARQVRFPITYGASAVALLLGFVGSRLRFSEASQAAAEREAEDADADSA